MIRDLNADSDSKLDPHAYILRPDVVLEISKELVKEEGHYKRSKKACELSLKHMKAASDKGNLIIDDKEKKWLEKLQDTISKLPADEGSFVEKVKPTCEKFNPALYDM